MDNFQKDTIKNEALNLIKEGYSSIDVSNRLFLKYGKKNGLSKREFDNKYGRFIRRNMDKKTSKSDSAKIVSFPTTQGNEIITKDGKPVAMNEHIKELKRDGSYQLEINNVPSMVRDDSAILKQFNLDETKFEIASFRESDWDAQTKRGIKQLHSYRVTVIPKKPTIEDSLEHLKNKLNSMPELSLPASRLDVQGDEIAIFCVPDLHLGKFAEANVCGTSTNTNKTIKAFYQMLSDTIALIKLRPVEKILFYWSQDFFHYDTTSKTTTRGTRQDTDLGYQNLFDLGIELLTTAITKLSEIAPVKTFYTLSNHDEMTGSHAATTLKYVFRDNPNVEVDDSKHCRHYEKYGVNLFGFAHGDKEGKRISGMMQYEVPKYWAESQYREWLMGHYHSNQLKEEFGIVFKYLQSPTGTDEWHTQSGYVGAWKCGTLLIRNKKYGPIFDIPLMVLEDRMEGRDEAFSAEKKLLTAA